MMTATDPLRAYALACRVGAINKASYAALQCLHIPLKDLIHSTTFEIRHLTALRFKSLLRYYGLCQQTAANVLSSWCFPWKAVSFLLVAWLG